MRISDWSSDVCSSDLGRSPDRRADQTTGGDLFPLLSGGRSGLWRAVVSEHSSNNERWVCDAGPPHFRSAGISLHDPSSPTHPGRRGCQGRYQRTQRTPDRERSAASVPEEEGRSEEHTSELQSLMRISYAVFCLKKKTTTKTKQQIT